MTDEKASRYNIHDARANLSRIIDRVERGEAIIITRADKPVARVVPVHGFHRSGRGSLKDVLQLSPAWDSDAANAEIAEPFGAGS